MRTEIGKIKGCKNRNVQLASCAGMLNMEILADRFHEN
jgi:hypothetical protein